MDEVKKLNKEQLSAVRYGRGPLLIIAGAGTGKTTVVTERIKYFILSGKAKPSEILALTFTEKAAREMEERVDVNLPYGYTQMWISTFHSFCDRVLRDQALHIGLDPKYRLMTEANVIQLIRNNLFKFDLDYFRPLGNPTKFISGMIQHFSRLQDEDVTPNQYFDWVKSKVKSQKSKLGKEEKIEIQKWLELADAYKKYEEIKIQEGVMDFGDLIVKTLKLFRERSNVLREYQKKFNYLLVDEFQDTNISQYELIKLLAPPRDNPNLSVVGDDSQSIYKFRGAAVSNILSFKKDYKKAKTVVLIKNYRSTQIILDAAYRLVQHNNPDTLETQLGISKNLKSIQGDKKETDVTFIHSDRVENEADQVAKKILRLIAQDRYKYRDFAILVRANNHSEPFGRALSRHGIPYQFLGPGRLFKQAEVVDLISYLKVLYNFEDSVAFYRLLAIDYLNISSRDLAAIGNFARRFNLSLFEACDPPSSRRGGTTEGQGALTFVSSDTREKIQKILEIIHKHLSMIKKETAGQLLYYFLENSGLIQKLLSPDNPQAEKRALNISRFFDKLKTYEVDHQDATIPAVVDWIELSSDLGESPLAADIDWTNINAVNILTVHSSKGLEFPVVFLVNLVAQRFPTIERREQIPIPEELIKEVLPVGDYHLEEERRLFYVGMTRARDLLFFTAADYYGEGKREKKLSPFIFEALGDEAVSSEQFTVDSEQLSFLDYKPTDHRLQVTDHSLLLHIGYLSYSQIETFRICPLHYKLKYIYKVPTFPSSSQSFGNSFHLTLKAFYEAIIRGEKPTEKLIYRCLEDNWIGEGYLGKKHESISFAKAKRFLKHYLENTFKPKVLPIAMEQPFLVKLENLRIGGKMDRIDVHKDQIEIIDYKTGSTPLTQKEADSNLQLSIYALAATSIPETPFDKRPEEVKLSLYYFDTPSIVTTTRTKTDLEKAREMIKDFKKQIENSDFKCSRSFLCQNCEYKFLCRSED